MKKLIVVVCAAFVVAVVGAVSIKAAQKDYEQGCISAYIDEDGDGICDHAAYKSLTCLDRKNNAGYISDYIDANGDGICDNAAQKNYDWKNNGGYTSAYIDVNGDGICDHRADNERCYENCYENHRYGYHHGR